MLLVGLLLPLPVAAQPVGAAAKPGFDALLYGPLPPFGATAPGPPASGAFLVQTGSFLLVDVGSKLLVAP